MATQCTATAKGSGQRCKRTPSPGQRVCRMHGGASPQARQKARERLALADALANDDRRTPAEVLADVAHGADFLMRQARLSVTAGKPTDKLLELTEAAGRWARTTIDVGVAERQTRVAEAEVTLLFTALERIFDRLQLTPTQQQLVTVVVPEELQRLDALPAGGAS